MNLAYIALGSNLGDREAHLDAALQQLALIPDSRLGAISSYYESPAWGNIEQGDFVNAVVAIHTILPPTGLLEHLQQIEDAAGRNRTEHWGPRTLDLDMLEYAGVTMEAPHLKLPHPHWATRLFVIIPWMEIAPQYMPGRHTHTLTEQAQIQMQAQDSALWPVMIRYHINPALQV